ncbi:MAG: chorismate-binding protein, partial [Weissella confusa]
MSFPSEKQLRDRFAQAENAVYFATADKRSRYYGFGIAEELIGASFEEVADWAKQQRYPVFGGFAFDDQTVPDSQLMNGYFVLPAVLYDITDQYLWGRETNPFGAPYRQEPVAILATADETDWPERVNNAIQDMTENDTHQKVVLGRQRQVTLSGQLNLAKLLADLADQQPNSYHMVIKRGDEVFISATPERLAKVNRGQFETAGVAGTIRRGETEAEDGQLADELLHDAKNLQEHAYVVETIVDRLGDVADLTLPDGPQIMKNPQVQHLYTPIAGKLRGENTVLALAER